MLIRQNVGLLLKILKKYEKEVLHRRVFRIIANLVNVSICFESHCIETQNRERCPKDAKYATLLEVCCVFRPACKILDQIPCSVLAIRGQYVDI